MARLLLAFALATLTLPACKASLGDEPQPIEDDGADADDSTPAVDASIDAPTPDAEEPDAPIDAPMPRPCAGGVATATTCFMKGPATATWQAAQSACAALYPGSSQLAKITSAEDQTALATVAAGVSDAWIGANDITTETTFVWSDTTPLVYTNWSAGEPNNGGTNGEDCTVTVLARNFGWDDRPCGISYQYVCSYPLLP